MIKAKSAPSAEQIKGFERRINNLLDEKQTIGVDVADIYTEAKQAGVNTTALRKVIAKRRAKTPDPEIVAAMEAYEFALDAAASMVSNGSTSLRKAAADTGFSKSAIHRRASHRNENASSGTDAETTSRAAGSAEGRDETVRQGSAAVVALELNAGAAGGAEAPAPITETAGGTPLGEGAGTTDKPDGPGSALATHIHESCGPRADRPVEGALGEGSPAATPVGPREMTGTVEIRRAQAPSLAGSTSPQDLIDSTDADRLRAQIPHSTDPEWLEREADRCLSGRVSRSDEQETDDVHVQHGSRLGDEVAGADMGSPHVRGLQAPHGCVEGGRQEGEPARLRSEQGRVLGEDREAVGGHREEGRGEEAEEALCHEEQAQATGSLGAVGSDSDRVAAPESDGLDIPPFLRRTVSA